jgi:hypothetical protein
VSAEWTAKPIAATPAIAKPAAIIPPAFWNDPPTEDADDSPADFTSAKCPLTSFNMEAIPAPNGPADADSLTTPSAITFSLTVPPGRPGRRDWR